MIEIRIHNHSELARDQRFLTHFVPGRLLRGPVELEIAERIRSTLIEEGVDASVEIRPDHGSNGASSPMNTGGDG